jgi:hypothetical protein
VCVYQSRDQPVVVGYLEELIGFHNPQLNCKNIEDLYNESNIVFLNYLLDFGFQFLLKRASYAVESTTRIEMILKIQRKRNSKREVEIVGSQAVNDYTNDVRIQQCVLDISNGRLESDVISFILGMK